MFVTDKLKSAFGLFGAALLASQALGHGGGGDIAVYETAGQVDVGFAVLDDDDINQVSFDPNDRVFQAVLTPVVGAPSFIPWDFGSSEPGFDANEGDLPAEAQIGWNVLSIKHWDGAGALAFAPATDVEGGYAPQPDLTDTLGGFHAHPTFGLSDLTGGPEPLADGVYLTELSISVAGLEDSDPFYLVSLVDSVVNSQPDPVATAESLGEAIRDYLAADTTDPGFGAPTIDGKSFGFYAEAIQYAESLVVPEPGAAALLLSACGLLAMRRR